MPLHYRDTASYKRKQNQNKLHFKTSYRFTTLLYIPPYCKLTFGGLTGFPTALLIVFFSSICYINDVNFQCVGLYTRTFVQNVFINVRSMISLHLYRMFKSKKQAKQITRSPTSALIVKDVSSTAESIEVIPSNFSRQLRSDKPNVHYQLVQHRRAPSAPPTGRAIKQKLEPTP